MVHRFKTPPCHGGKTGSTPVRTVFTTAVDGDGRAVEEPFKILGFHLMGKMVDCYSIHTGSSPVVPAPASDRKELVCMATR